MPDIKRYKKYRKEIDALKREISFEAAQKIINEKLLEYVSRYPKADRHELKRVIEKTFGPEFGKYVAGVFRKYNDVLAVVNDLYNDLGIDIKRDFARIRNIEEINKTQLGKYEQDAVNYMTRRLRKALADNLKIKELSKQLKQFGGRVETYADTISRTQIKGYSRLAKNEKARIGEVVWYQYVGRAPRENSHELCILYYNQYLHIDEILKISNGQLEPFAVYCGGFNCVHDLEPDPFKKDK